MPKLVHFSCDEASTKTYRCQKEGDLTGDYVNVKDLVYNDPFELKQMINLSDVHIEGIDFEAAVLEYFESFSSYVGNNELIGHIPEELDESFARWCESQPGYIPDVEIQLYRSW